MARVIGVKFKNSGKSYFFDPVNFDVHKDDHVIVETGKGIDFGFVVSDIREISDDKIFQPLKPILRKATERDEEQVAENHVKEKEAFRICLEKIHEHNLDMKLTEAEYAFDNSKILFYFTSDGYVDFRDLVKDLASVFRTRIELRQIGVRDEARALGGLGACGRPMCCATYLADFVPVSIKMAKEQNLPLNPSKISGVCGRLMCCLKNEEETYEELNKTMPAVGDIVEGDDGLQGEVFSTNVLRQLVKVVVTNGDEKEMHDYSAANITIIRRRRGKKNTGRNEETIDEKQLAALEDKPTESEEKKNRHERNENREKRENRGNGEGRNENRENRENSGEGKNENRENRGEGKNENRENRENRGEGKNENRENRENRGEGKNENRENRGNGEGRNRDHRKGKHGNGENRGNNDDRNKNRDNVNNGGDEANGENGNKNNHSGHHHRKHHNKFRNKEGRDGGNKSEG